MTVSERDVLVRELRPEDIPRFFQWGHHDDLRFLHYNFPILSPEEQREWYRIKKVPLYRWIYIAEAEGRLLGYLSVRNIGHIFRWGELGVVFDPALVGQGYGTAAMIAFLRIFFFKKHMRVMYLRVADFNQRARRAYEKVGFQYMRTVSDPFEEQERNFELVLNHPESFWMEGTVLMSTFQILCITRSRFIGLYGKEVLR